MEQHAMHSMATTTTNAMTAAMTAAMATSTSSSGMGKHDGMHMSKCKISMLWNWNTIDACFISSTWRITSKGKFAGSCIGVICLVLILELLRRIGREYDAFIIRRGRLHHSQSQSPLDASTTTIPGSGPDPCIGIPSSSRPSSPPDGSKPAPSTTAAAVSPPPGPATIRPKLAEQLVRALLHTLQFAVAYFVMLLAMYYNGYIIICIFIGAFLGAFIFSWEGLGGGEHRNDATAVTKCCG